MQQEFSGKVVFVTGGGSGIGLATARAFADAGAIVVIAEMDDVVATKAAGALWRNGHQALGIGCDVTVEAQVAAALDQVVNRFGRLDVAFNNAGVISRQIETAEMDMAEWDRVMAVNLRGTWTCMKHEIRHMLLGGSGSIVNCSSIGGLRGVAGLPAYIASKHGVLGLTKAAALEYCRRGIRINAVCPGQVDTPMNDWLTDGDEAKTQEMVEKTQPIGRLGTPEEIASAVLWLAGPGAGFVIGHALAVDGGQAAR